MAAETKPGKRRRAISKFYVVVTREPDPELVEEVIVRMLRDHRERQERLAAAGQQDPVPAE